MLIIHPQYAVCLEQNNEARGIRIVNSFSDGQPLPQPADVDAAFDPGFEFVLQNGHDCEIDDIVIDPKGNFMVSHDRNGGIKLWDIKTGRVLRNFRHNKRYENCNLLAIDPHSKYIITGAEDGTVRVWSFQENKLIKVFGDGKIPITGVAMDREGRVFAANSHRGFTIWDMENDAPVTNYLGPGSTGFQQLALDPKGRYCILTKDGILKRYDLQTGRMGESFSSASGEIGDIKIAPNGDLLALGCWYGDIEIRNPLTGKLIRTIEAHRMKKYRRRLAPLVSCVCFDPSSDILASGGLDGSIKIWRVKDGTLIRAIEKAHINVTSMAIDPKGELLVSGGLNGEIKVWNLKTGDHVRTLLPLSHRKDMVDRIVKYDTDLGFNFLVTETGNNVVSVWNLNSLELIRNFSLFTNQFSFELDPHGRFLITSHRNNHLKKWDLRTGELLKSFAYDRKGYSINEFQIDHDGKYIVSIHDHVSRPQKGVDPVANIWSMETDIHIGTIHNVRRIIIGPNGRYIAGLTGANGIGIWELHSGNHLHTFQRENIAHSQLKPVGGDIPPGRQKSGRGEVMRMIIGPDSRFLLSVYENGEMDILDIKNKKLVETIRISPHRLLSIQAKHIQFDSSGRYICYSGYNNQGAGIWETHTGKLVCRMTHHGGDLGSVIINPKRETAVTVNGNINLWDLTTGRLFRTIKGKMRADQWGLDTKGLRLAAKAGDKIEIWNLQRGELESTLDIQGEICNFRTRTKGIGTKTVVLAEDSGKNAYLLDPFSGNRISEFEFAHEQIKHEWLQFQIRREYMITVDQNIQISLRNLNTKSSVDIVNAGPEWIAYTKEGYFDSSRHGGSMVAMEKDLKAYAMDQFAIRNNRPDIILSKMALGERGLVKHFADQYKKRLKRMEIFNEKLPFELHIPTTEILETKQEGKFLTLTCAFNDTDYPLKSYNLYINDVPLFKDPGKKLGNNHAVKTERVELIGGNNKIEVTCINAMGAESYRALRYVDYHQQTVGDLYYVGFGVSSYQDPDLDLKYAHKDATDLAELFIKMKGTFNEVHAKTFVNGQVGKENINTAKEFLSDAGVDDTLVLFIAGHGLHLMGEKSTYYYLTHFSSLVDIPATALPYDAFEDLLMAVKPRKKLFLMDTCESGEVEEYKQNTYFTMAEAKGFKPRTTRAVTLRARKEKNGVKTYSSGFNRYIYNDLIRRTGAIVFSSSKGNEFSYESDKAENGFFTKGIIKAMQTQTADKDGNRYLSVEELREYVISEVSRISGEMQHPTVDRDNIYQKINFPLLSLE